MEISLASNIRFGQKNLMAVLRVLGIIVGVMFFYCTIGIVMWDREVEVGAEFPHRWRTRQRRAAVGHRSGPPEALLPIFLPHTPFFWDVNVRVTKNSALSSASVDLHVKTLWHQLISTSSR